MRRSLMIKMRDDELTGTAKRFVSAYMVAVAAGMIYAQKGKKNNGKR